MQNCPQERWAAMGLAHTPACPSSPSQPQAPVAVNHPQMHRLSQGFMNVWLAKGLDNQQSGVQVLGCQTSLCS